jgi:hypothetical protein
MTFEEILDQAIAMLQRRGCVSYRTLTLQFHLDQEALEALKEELIEVHHRAGVRLAAAREEQTCLKRYASTVKPRSSPARVAA